VLKIHVHTDEPEEVFAYLRSVGDLVTHKAEDMRAQHAAVERAAGAHVQLARRPVTVVTDSAGDLPEDVVRAHGIHVTPCVLIDGDRELKDGIDITAVETSLHGTRQFVVRKDLKLRWPRAETPTPRGRFFVEEALALRPGTPGAPYAFALSARSNVYQEFEGGPGQIAIHSTYGIGGTLGTAVSHGCVRLSTSALRWIAARFGAGVPVTVT